MRAQYKRRRDLVSALPGCEEIERRLAKVIGWDNYTAVCERQSIRGVARDTGVSRWTLARVVSGRTQRIQRRTAERLFDDAWEFDAAYPMLD